MQQLHEDHQRDADRTCNLHRLQDHHTDEGDDEDDNFDPEQDDNEGGDEAVEDEDNYKHQDGHGDA